MIYFISQGLYLSLIGLQCNNTYFLIFLCAYDMIYIIMSFVKPLFSDPLDLVLFARVFVGFCVNKLLPNFQGFFWWGLGTWAPHVTYPLYLDAIICDKGENYFSLLLLQNEPTLLVADFSMELQGSY